MARAINPQLQDIRNALASNADGTALASTARTTTSYSNDITNATARGIIIYLNITAASGTGGLQVRVYGKDPASAQYFALNGAPTAKTTTGSFPYVFYPGAASGATLAADQIVSGPLPRTFRIGVTHGDASSYTYSVGYSLIV